MRPTKTQPTKTQIVQVVLPVAVVKKLQSIAPARGHVVVGGPPSGDRVV